MTRGSCGHYSVACCICTWPAPTTPAMPKHKQRLLSANGSYRQMTLICKSCNGGFLVDSYLQMTLICKSCGGYIYIYIYNDFYRQMTLICKSLYHAHMHQTPCASARQQSRYNRPLPFNPHNFTNPKTIFFMRPKQGFKKHYAARASTYKYVWTK